MKTFIYFFMLISLCFCMSCKNEYKKYYKSFDGSAIFRLQRTKFIPISASEITFFYTENMLGECLEWKCIVRENDFFEFAKQNNWSVVFNQVPAGVFNLQKIEYFLPQKNFLFATSNGIIVKNDSTWEINNAHRGIKVIYDISKNTMYGSYTSR